MPDVRLAAAHVDREEEILTAPALAFVADLQARFGARRDELLARRAERRKAIARTGFEDIPEAEIRQHCEAVLVARREANSRGIARPQT